MGEVSYRPLIDDMVFSYSRLECFEDCPYKWFLKYIGGYRESGRFYSSYGSLVHSLIQRYYLGLLKADELPVAFLTEFSSSVEGDRPSDQIVEKYVSAGLSYFRSFKPFPYETIGTEVELRFSISGVPFVGFVDYLGKTDGGLVIVDHKSRDIKPRSNRKKPTENDRTLDKMLRQLYLYAEGVRQVYREQIKLLCFNLFRINSFIAEPFSQTASDEAIAWALRTVEEIKACEDFYPNIDYFPCRWLCGVSEQCLFTGGKEA